MNKRDLKGLNTTEMIHCDGCGRYHTLEDSEIVIIRMVKGKDCELGSFSNPSGDKFTGVTDSSPAKETSVPVKGTIDEIVNPTGSDLPVRPRPSIIPRGLEAMMIPPGDPEHETKGAKEVRRT